MKPDGPGQSAILLTEVATRLDGLRIPYAVVGGLAASFHGVVRSSLDADVVISAVDRKAVVPGLIRELKEAGWNVVEREGGFEDPVASVIAVSDGYANRVDILTGIRGMAPGFVSRTIPSSLFGATLRMISLEDFIAMKLFAGGPRDVEDARAALRVSSSALDLRLLKELAAGYGRVVVRSLVQLLRDTGVE
ncbi:MAG: hypothetical protein EHM61_04820 [Acidobacteria bacterium]|nr:MAG: hypothetical protein EHM61_04820 [Acidobacteriota bacterium]